MKGRGREGRRAYLPGSGIQRREQQIFSQGACLCQTIQEGGLATVGVPDEGDHRIALRKRGRERGREGEVS